MKRHKKMPKTFINITNNQVYEELCKLKQMNAQEHQQIMNQIIGYRSQVSRLQWALGAVGGMMVLNLGWFIAHIL